MKKLMTFSVFYLLFANPIFSQILTFRELMDLAKCSKPECFNNFILQKGFSVLKSEKSVLGYKSYTYLSKNAFLASGTSDSLVKTVAGIFLTNNLSVKTFFKTNVTQQYQSILNQIKHSGFKADKTEFLENGVRVYYFNSKMRGYQVVVSEYRLIINGSKKYMNLYEVQVLKNRER